MELHSVCLAHNGSTAMRWLITCLRFTSRQPRTKSEGGGFIFAHVGFHTKFADQTSKFPTPSPLTPPAVGESVNDSTQNGARDARARKIGSALFPLGYTKCFMRSGFTPPPPPPSPRGDFGSVLILVGEPTFLDILRGMKASCDTDRH